MPPPLTTTPSRHRRISARLVVESLLVFGGLELLALTLVNDGESLAAQIGLPLTIVALGCWFHRLYTNAHEAIHKMLFPQHLWLNDLVGQILLLPLLIPLPVYRKIHAFHHGHNRRNHETSTLDGYVVKPGPGRLKRASVYGLWYVGVFFGGYFLHGLVSIILFLCLPQRVARSISPAFKGWRLLDQLRSWLAFGLGGLLHVSVALAWGVEAWAVMFGFPFLVFAWLYSLLVYIYHYRTSYGPEVRFNVRLNSTDLMLGSPGVKDDLQLEAPKFYEFHKRAPSYWE